MPITSINIYTLKQIRTRSHRYDLEDYQITSPLICYKVLQYLLDLKSEPVEKFGIISLNTRNKIIGLHIIGIGSPEPSQDDIFLTRKLRDAGKIMGIELLDQVITGEKNYCSLKEKGLI